MYKRDALMSITIKIHLRYNFVKIRLKRKIINEGTRTKINIRN